MKDFSQTAGEASAASLGRLIDEACDYFEAAWQAGAAPRIEDSLDGWEKAERESLVRELIQLDCYYRRAAGTEISSEDYLARFPPLDASWLTGVLANDALCSGAEPPTSALSPFTQDSDETTETNYDFLAPAQHPGELGRLGPYLIRKVLGVGGMGVVFLAYDPHLERLVALKAMLPALAASPSGKQRFFREAKAAAALKHDHIVTIYQVGEDRGVPFLTMELLEGESLDARLKRELKGEAARPLSLSEMLRIGRETAEGLAVAHQHGLIHRDIKPGNLWLEAGTGRVKILDFGLVRTVTDDAPPQITVAGAPSADDNSLTQADALLGTPAYMAPEQAGNALVDARCDLFSLGCVLYRAATGELPFKGRSAFSTLAAACTNSPAPPRELSPALPSAFCELVMLLLAKKPDDRPPSARAVVEAIVAIERRQTALPKAAPSRWRFARRVWPVVVAALLGLLAVSGLRFGPTLANYALNEGELVIEIDGPQVQAVVDQTGVALHDKATERTDAIKPGRHNLKAGDYEVQVSEVGGGVSLFTQAFTVTRGGKASVKVTLDLAAVAEKPVLKVSELRRLEGYSHGDWVTQALFAHGSRQVVTCSVGGSGDIRVWDTQTGRLLHRFADGLGGWGLVLSPDGRQIYFATEAGLMRLYDLESGAEVRTFPSGQGEIAEVAVSPDGLSALTTSNDDRDIRMWDVKTGKERWRIPGQKSQCIAFCPDGRYFAAGSRWDPELRQLRLCAVEDGKEIRTFANAGAGRVSFSPDGRRVLGVGRDNALRSYDVNTGKELRTFEGHTAAPYMAVFSPDSRRILSAGGDDRSIRLWDASTGAELQCVRGFDGPVSCVNFSPDGRLAVSSALDGSVRLWRLPEPPPPDGVGEVRCFEGHTDEVRGAAFSPDGRRALSAGFDGTVRLWDVGTGKEARRFEGHRGPVSDTAFSPDGTRVVSGGVDATVRLWDAESGKELRRLEGHEGYVDCVVFSPDGRRILSSQGQTMRLWDATTGDQIKSFEGSEGQIRCVAFSPDGRHALSGGHDRVLRLWNLETGEQISHFTRQTDWILGAAFSPDGLRALAAGGADSSIVLWDVKTGQEVRRYEGHTKMVHSVAFSRDGGRMLSAGFDRTLRLWDVETGKQLLCLSGHTETIIRAVFSPDGREALSGSSDNTMRLWRLSDAARAPEKVGKEK